MGLGCTEQTEVGRFRPDNEDGGVDAAQPVELTPSHARIALGYASSCAIRSDGQVQCWGTNDGGELGVGDLDLGGSSQPLTPLGLEAEVRAIFGGRISYCAVMTNGRARCWGGAPFFSVPYGDASVPLYAQLFEPREVDDLSFVASMGLGFWFHCALNVQGGVKCYGFNSEGQLGNGTLDDTLSPIDVVDLAPAQSVAAASHFACAVTMTGAVECWGDNEHGQLGDGTTDAKLKPVPVAGLPPGASAVACGWQHSCAIVDGAVHCWGRNQYGQLGAGSDAGALSPVAVPGMTSIEQIVAGAFHTCARSSAGQVFCWGTAESGSSPDGPALIVAEGALELAAGAFHNCARVGGDFLRCWGSNDAEALGPFAGDGAPL